MNINNFNYEEIEILSGAYFSISEIFNVDPINATQRKQKRLKKWFIKSFIDDETPLKIKEFAFSDLSEQEFFRILKECFKKIEEEHKLSEENFQKNISNFSDDVKTTFSEILDDYIPQLIRRKGNNIVILNCNYNSFRNSLVFENVIGLSDFDGKGLFFRKETLEKTDIGYRIKGDITDYTTDDTTPFTIEFKNIKVEYEIFNAVNKHFSPEGPWEFLSGVAFEIYQKSLQVNIPLNNKEKELLPLIYELKELYTGIFYQSEGNYRFELLRKIISKWNFTELFKILDSIEKNGKYEKKRIFKIKILKNTLNRQKYEPLWRYIYDEIALSQKDYPDLSEALYPDLVKETRQKIENQLKSQGYIGEYPDFYKIGSIKKIHLAESYGMSYFVGCEKKAVFRVHCFENDCFNDFEVQLISGTELLKKNEIPKDIYSCFFNAKGRRFFKETYLRFEYVDENKNIASDDITTMVNVAIKRAELKKLTKQEREAAKGIFPYTFFVASGLAMGLFFGLFMTIGFMLMAVITALITGVPNEIPSLLKEGPWLLVFCFTGGSFGIIMGIITLLCKRR